MAAQVPRFYPDAGEKQCASIPDASLLPFLCRGADQAIAPDSSVQDVSAPIDVFCGPLLNYKSMHYEPSAVWNGSVLIVTKSGQRQPQLVVRRLGPVGTDAKTNGELPRRPFTADGIKLYEEPGKAFWRFSIQVPLEAYECRWQYDIPGFQYVSSELARTPWNFAVPSVHQSMRIMFHSCNGFSVGTPMDEWVGPVLWEDVLRTHHDKPFHVMVGGGDQIYNDSVGVDGPLQKWTGMTNPHKRRVHDFNEGFRASCDEYYYDNYVRWYTTGSFKAANAQIPQINIWDDHDIIDGFGSYIDHFMKCAVFRGVGGVAFKYYCLFQQHIAPPKSTFTTDSVQTMRAVNGTTGADPHQLKDTFVLENQKEDESWIIGKRPGPYVKEKSRNLYMRLGRRIGFVALDARTERTRHQVNYPDTYDLVFSRLEREVAAARGELKHLIVLLGVPIAYPRLAFLENILTSPLMVPVRFLNKRFGFADGLFNNFDGQIDLLDDLDDHYTAKHHKRERKHFMLRLQQFAKAHSIRVTILGGDVHLSAIGRFYSKPRMGLQSENDHRYMVNIISSAITNKPPPKAVANLLAQRNKLHHLDHRTDETLMPFFDKQPGDVEKSASWNDVTMPSRNYACITEVDEPSATDNNAERPSSPPKDGHSPLHQGEVGAGSTHVAADGVSSKGDTPGGLNVSVRVEIDPHIEGAPTEGYGFSSKFACPHLFWYIS